MDSEQPDTPANESAVAHPPGADAAPLPIARPVRPAGGLSGGRRRPSTRLGRVARIGLLAVAGGLVAVFVMAFRIHPYGEDGTPLTMSTHTQLGLAPCNFVALTGKPCPSCGMTTSFALLVRGDVSASVRANWVGSLICVLWAGTLVWAAASGVRGRPLFVPPGRGELVFTLIVGTVLVLMLGRWAAILIRA